MQESTDNPVSLLSPIPRVNMTLRSRTPPKKKPGIESDGGASPPRFVGAPVPATHGEGAHAAVHRALARLAELAGSPRRAFASPRWSETSLLERQSVSTDVSLFTVFYYHHLYLLDDELVAELMDQLCDLLRDPKVWRPRFVRRRRRRGLIWFGLFVGKKIEVREASASTLSGIVRCSQRSAIVSLSNRFLGVLRSTRIPKRRDANGNEVAGYQEALVAARASFSFLSLVSSSRTR